MNFLSPKIQNGSLVLNEKTGQLVMTSAIETQCNITVSAYDCIYNTEVNSGLIPYIKEIPIGGRNNTKIVNIIKAAFQILISQGILSQLTIAVVAQVKNYINVKITATDIENNSINLTWSNT